MARHEERKGWERYGYVPVRPKDRSYEIGFLASLARRLRCLFARDPKKKIESRYGLKVICKGKSTGEQETMKDCNGKEAFVHIDGAVYVSVAFAAGTIESFTRLESGVMLSGASRIGSIHCDWTVRPGGDFDLSTWSADKSMYAFGTNMPRVEAFLKKPEAKVEELNYKLNIDTSDAKVALEQIAKVIGDSPLVKGIAECQGEAEKALSKAVLEIIEQESRPGGAIWCAKVPASSITTFQGESFAQLAEPVKSIDDLAREIYDDRRASMIVESPESRWTEAYKLAGLRIRLRESNSQ